MKNQKGSITVDYLFAFVLVGGFSFLIFALSVSLSVVEVVQYMTFASARNYYAGNLDPENGQFSQIQAGNNKFNSLASDPVFAPLFKNGWFKISNLSVGSISQNPNPDFAQYRSLPPIQNMFQGTVVTLTLSALDFNVPFFGSTSTGQQNGKKKEFASYVGSYLGREITFRECENFMIDRFPEIKKLKTNNGDQPYANVRTTYVYIPPDNGC